MTKEDFQKEKEVSSNTYIICIMVSSYFISRYIKKKNFTEVGAIEANQLVQVPAFRTFLASVGTFLAEVKRKFCPDFSNNSSKRPDNQS